MGLPGDNVQLIVWNKFPELKREGWDRKADVGATDIQLVIEAINTVEEKWAMDNFWRTNTWEATGRIETIWRVNEGLQGERGESEKRDNVQTRKYISEKNSQRY